MLLLTGPKTEYQEVFMSKTLVRNNVNYIKVLELKVIKTILTYLSLEFLLDPL